jgi:hypothetical protein
MMSNNFEQNFKNINAWWNHRNIGRVLFEAYVSAQQLPDRLRLNRYWDSPNCEPDIDSLAQEQVRASLMSHPVGDAMPMIYHLYGGRGTPVALSWYLGGNIKFTDRTVWVDPVIKDWKSFSLKFDQENKWVKLSDRLMETQAKYNDGNAIAWMPDLGDALTCFSLMRGAEELMFDMLDCPDIISDKIQEFTKAFILAHKHFSNLYRKFWPGNASALMWAPGPTYMCQCDFSNMISPDMFRLFVVPELNNLSQYLEYMLWHLDGFEQVRHLPILLELPYIRAFQIQPGANNPPACSKTWLPICKKIQESGKSLYVYANTPEQFECLVKSLDSTGLMISCTYPISTQREAEHHMAMTQNCI